jgi:hypothetical protein
MTTWFNAQESIVAAANNAMNEMAKDGDHRSVWEPIAQALMESIPEDFERDWPEEFAAAENAGADFVGVTSDTRRPVFWGEDHGAYREFIVG